MINAAKRNDYERVKILFKYGYRLEQKDNITDPLKKIELFKVWFWLLLVCAVCQDIIVLEIEVQNVDATDKMFPFDVINNTTNSQAVASPAYIVASLENLNEVSADFFCPVKKCFEYACEANFRKSMIPEYMREYEEIEIRWEVYYLRTVCTIYTRWLLLFFTLYYDSQEDQH